MQQLRIGRVVGMAMLAFGALATTGCLGDSSPTDVDITDEHVFAVGVRISQQLYNVALFAEDSENADILALADSIAAHQEAQFDAFFDLGLTARESDLSQYILGRTNQLRNYLSVMTGEEFDRNFIDAQITLHEDAIGYIDDDLLPIVEDADLEAELYELRGILTADLISAQAIQVEIGPPTT